jgi:hypothetical protein
MERTTTAEEQQQTTTRDSGLLSNLDAIFHWKMAQVHRMVR